MQNPIIYGFSGITVHLDKLLPHGMMIASQDIYDLMKKMDCVTMNKIDCVKTVDTCNEDSPKEGGEQ